MKSPVEVVEVERGVRTCQEPDCKTDATYKIIEIQWKKDGDGLQGIRKATYLCKKHYKEVGTKE